MRDVKPALTAAWESGDFIGDRRPAARITIQQAGVSMYDVGYNLYSSLPFGRPQPITRDLNFNTSRAGGVLTPALQRKIGTATSLAKRYVNRDPQPKELPNLVKVSWQRDADAEIASATMEFLNCEPLPLGTVAHEDYEQPGYFTFNRGNASYSVRWGHTPNQWSGLLMPDNILRTYEGYGFDPTVAPERDPHLEQTGVWMIDKVDYGANGIISVTCRDLGRILSDQIIFPPVAPKKYYPLSLTYDATEPGFVAGKTYSKIVTSGGDQDPKHPPPDAWKGPVTAPGIGNSVDQDGAFKIGIYPPAGGLPAGYDIAGYQIRLDNVLQPRIYPPAGSSVDPTVTGLTNGDVYLVNACVIYRQKSTGRTHVGNASEDRFARPRQAGGPNVVPGTLLINTDADGNQNAGETHPGQLVWRYVATGRISVFSVIFYKTVRVGGGFQPGTATSLSKPTLRRFVYNVVVPAKPAGSTQVVEYVAPAEVRPLDDWNILVFGTAGNPTQREGFNPLRQVFDTGTPAIGAGESYFRASGGEFYFPPTPGAAPQQTSGGAGPTPVKLSYDTSSNDYYDGQGDRSVYNHNPRDAFDGRTDTYFLSVGNGSPSRGFAFEWAQGTCAGQTLTGATFSTVKSGYTAYVSVFARGTWVHFNPGDIVPYNPDLPQSHNGGNIPWAATASVPSEAPVTVRFPQPIPGATKVRVTLRNLQNFGLGTYKYRGAIREMSAISNGALSTGPAVDVTDPVVVSTYTVTEPPYVKPGLGQHPMKYNDYTDIIKLFCAWGGFFWPKNASVLNSDGTEQKCAYGPGPYGLPAYIDPVLGTDAGRVWGDFEQTGAHGITDLTSDLWDKKTLLDAIVYLREIVGFLFYVDEFGSIVWKHRNIYAVGNDVANLSQQPRRTTEVVTLDETRELMALSVSLDSKNVRERVFISSTDGTNAGLSQGFNPNPIGLRRVGGWTDQNFASDAECQRMADFICLRQMFTYRQNNVTIPGYPKIQVNDQVRLFERVTSEGYIHYVAGISSSNDLRTGEWNYQLTTQWLGENPGDLWVFHPSDFSAETLMFLDGLGLLPDGGSGALPKPSQPTPAEVIAAALAAATRVQADVNKATGK